MKEGKTIRRKYDRSFKLEAIRLVEEEGRQVTEVARDLGIGANLIHRWRRKLEEEGTESFPGKGHLKPSDEELRCLRRENADLKEERDILKKVVAIFSKDPR